jgi:hypothetical protein
MHADLFVSDVGRAGLEPATDRLRPWAALRGMLEHDPKGLRELVPGVYLIWAADLRFPLAGSVLRRRIAPCLYEVDNPSKEKNVSMGNGHRSKSATAALVVLGIFLGSLIATTPAVGHVTAKWLHLRDKHVRPWADARYINTKEVVPAARIRRSTVQSIPNDTFVAVQFDVEDFDTKNLHNSAFDLSRLRAPVGGLYQITAAADFFVNATGTRIFQIQKNGTNILVSDTIAGSVDGDAVISALARLQAGEYVELSVKQTSGGSLNLAFGTATPLLSMHRVGPR